jgi:hypothetical protein
MNLCPKLEVVALGIKTKRSEKILKSTDKFYEEKESERS